MPHESDEHAAAREALERSDRDLAAMQDAQRQFLALPPLDPNESMPVIEGNRFDPAGEAPGDPHQIGVWFEVVDSGVRPAALTASQVVYLSIDGTGAGGTAADWLEWRDAAMDRASTKAARPEVDRDYLRLEIVRLVVQHGGTGSDDSPAKLCQELFDWVTGR